MANFLKKIQNQPEEVRKRYLRFAVGTSTIIIFIVYLLFRIYLLPKKEGKSLENIKAEIFPPQNQSLENKEENKNQEANLNTNESLVNNENTTNFNVSSGGLPLSEDK